MLSDLIRRSSLAAALLLAAVSPARGQQEQVTEFQSWRLPGWSFTPGVTIGTMFDSNVAVSQAALPGGNPASDNLFTVQPFGQLEFYDGRTSFSSGYGGMVRRYVDLTELNGVDHHAYLDLRRMLTRRVTFYTKENYMRVPTTDLLQLNGVPYQRTGSRYNDFSSGVEARLTRTIDVTTEYENQWVDFVRKDTPLTGGFVNGVHGSLTDRVSGRSSFGAEAGLRWANLAQGRIGFEVVPVTILFEDVGAVYRFQSGRQTLIEAAFGFSHLDDRTRGITRNGPYARGAVTHHTERATCRRCRSAAPTRARSCAAPCRCRWPATASTCRSRRHGAGPTRSSPASCRWIRCGSTRSAATRCSGGSGLRATTSSPVKRRGCPPTSRSG
jgi:hypothetical protein